MGGMRRARLPDSAGAERGLRARRARGDGRRATRDRDRVGSLPEVVGDEVTGLPDRAARASTELARGAGPARRRPRRFAGDGRARPGSARGRSSRSEAMVERTLAVYDEAPVARSYIRPVRSAALAPSVARSRSQAGMASELTESGAIVAASASTTAACSGVAVTLVVGARHRSTGTARAADDAGAAAAPADLLGRLRTDVVPLTDAELDTWKARGVDGFVCMTGRLRGLGGAQDFSGDPDASLTGANYALQRSLRDSRIVERATARGMKLYLGVKLANYYNDATPLKDWFDDAGWSREVLPKMRDLAAAAKLLRVRRDRLRPGALPTAGRRDDRDLGLGLPGQHPLRGTGASEGKAAGRRADGRDPRRLPGRRAGGPSRLLPGDWRELVQEEVNGDVRTPRPIASTSTSGTG